MARQVTGETGQGTPGQLFWPWIGANVSVLGLPPVPLALLGIGSVLGWGLVTNADASWLQWQGYLLGGLGLGGEDSDWAFANLGVLVALVVGFAGTLLLRRGAVRRQEAA